MVAEHHRSGGDHRCPQKSDERVDRHRQGLLLRGAAQDAQVRREPIKQRRHRGAADEERAEASVEVVARLDTFSAGNRSAQAGERGVEPLRRGEDPRPQQADAGGEEHAAEHGPGHAPSPGRPARKRGTCGTLPMRCIHQNPRPQ